MQNHTNTKSNTNSNSNTNTDTDGLSAVGAELHHLKDALGLQLHLGGKEAAQLWERVGKAITSMEGELKTLGAELATKKDEARLQAHLGVASLKARWPSVENGIADLIADAKKAAAGAETSLDEASVKAHLASMDAEDRGHEAVSSLKAAAKELDAQSAAAAAELRTRIKALRERLAGPATKQ